MTSFTYTSDHPAYTNYDIVMAARVRRLAAEQAAAEPAEFAALADDYMAGGLPLARYSRMLVLARRIARRAGQSSEAVLASAGVPAAS